MAEQYWVGNFFIDLSRNQITHENNTQQLTPKALAVLTYLAENQGQVVSQDALLAHVWQGTIVSSNTLQRCIAQLRKALGDDVKVQLFIKTHAKKGYSLECDVRWQNDNNPQLLNDHQAFTEQQTLKNNNSPRNNFTVKAHSTASENHQKKQQKSLTILLFAVLVLLVGIFIINKNSPEPKFQFSIKDIQPITSTDNRELASIYSPDGEYVVFKRFPEVQCINNLWAKHIKTHKEFQLTKDLGSYGNASFSSDGKTLAFVKEDNCTKPVTQKNCFQLQSLDFEQALNSPQVPTTLMECKNSEIHSVKWMNDDEIALLQKQTERWQLISYSISNDSSKTLYALENGNIITYDYSPEQNLIALISIHSDSQLYIETLSTNAQLLSSHRINYPKEIAKFRLIYPNFSPFSNQLIFSTGKQLFTLSFDGQISPINISIVDAIGTPVFHPDGKRMLAITGHYDGDIVSFPLAHFTKQPPLQDESQLNYTVIERSTFGEDIAKYQPHGDSIAYLSQRSGNSQVWITQGGNSQQLSHFPIDTYVQDLVWANDGKSILVNASSELKRLYLDGRETVINTKYPIANLFHWDSDKDVALVMMQINGSEKFIELNLANAEIHLIKNKSIQWAQTAENGQLIYLDQMNRFWQPGVAEHKLITALDGQGSDKHFIIKDNVVYGINEDFQLWSYALENEVFTLIVHLPKTVDYITDINQHALLLTMRIAARKDVVELTLN